MDYKAVYTENYFSGRDSFFYRLGYGRFSKLYFDNLFNSGAISSPRSRRRKNKRRLDARAPFMLKLLLRWLRGTYLD